MPHRIEKLNHQIRRELSEVIQRQVKDPRLGSLLSITEVALSSDLRHAKVFVSCICSEEEQQEMLKTLNGATHFFRKELTKSLRLRYIPELSFHWDDSIARADRLMQLLDQVSAEEKTRPPQ